VKLSDADREALYEQLARHHAAGRLSVEELEQRVAALAGAHTSEQAEPLLADLPPLPPEEGAAVAPARGRGHAEADAAEPGWSATSERFRDPRTGRVMRVWVDSGGGRHYVAEQS
jgi:hypothetical protein